MINILLTLSACDNPNILRIIYFALMLLKVVFIAVPIGLILMISIDLFKNVTANKEDDMKKNMNIAIKRILYCVFLFFVPTIVGLINTVLGDLGVSYTTCLDNATAEIIEQKTIEYADALLEEAKSEESLLILDEARAEINKINDDSTKKSYENMADDVENTILENIKQGLTEEPEYSPNTTNPSGSGGSSGSDSDGNSSGSGTSLATGTLTSPLNKNATAAEFKASIGGNSKTIYYLKGGYHGGTDLPVEIGTKVFSMDGGTVYSVQDGCGAYGRHIILEHVVSGKKYYTLYAHLSSIEKKFLTEGTVVHPGELIALSGNSYHCPGESGGTTVDAHLHVGISYNSSGRFPQSEGDQSFLVGNFIGKNIKYSIVEQSNLYTYKQQQY